MESYKITKYYGIYYGKWRDVKIEAESHHEAVIQIMRRIKEIVARCGCNPKK